MVSKTKRKQKLRRLKRRKSYCIIYALIHDGMVRYIGQSRQLPEDRLRWFYKAIDQKRSQRSRLSPVEEWIDQLSFFGIQPEMTVIDSNATWDVSEIIYIDRYRTAGHPLLNVTRGGIDGIGNIRREANGALATPRNPMPINTASGWRGVSGSAVGESCAEPLDYLLPL